VVAVDGGQPLAADGRDPTPSTVSSVAAKVQVRETTGSGSQFLSGCVGLVGAANSPMRRRLMPLAEAR